MEEASFALWNDGANSVVHREEVICGIDNECAIIQEGSSEHDSYGEVCEEVVVQQEVVGETIVPEVQSGIETDSDNIVYLTSNNMLVVPQTSNAGGHVVTFQDNFMECQVTEEVITDDWVNSQGEERVEIPVGEVGAEQQIEYDDMEVPLPIDQDEYTASRPYPCDFCSRRFRKKANLMNHMVAHQTDRPHGCNLCDALDEDELALPSLAESDTEKPAKKKKSGKKRKALALASPPKPKIKQEAFDSSDDRYEMPSRSYNYVDEDVRLLTEMENHVNASSRNDSYSSYNELDSSMTEVRYPILDPRKPFVCQHCGVAFAREKALASHARIHAGDSPFECETCNEMFWDVQVLREHVRTKHGGMAANESDYEDIDDDDYVDDSKYGDFYCKVCGMRFHRTDLLRRHMRNHDDVKEEFNPDETEYGHVCNVCGQSFNEALDLLAHAESHARQLGHRCMLCGECFTDETTMSTHVMQRHGKNMPPNTCMLCGKTCKDRRTLLKHSWDHSREKLFSCSKCGKSFHNKARLKRHMVSHRNKAVQCDICGDDFPDGRSLMNHRHSHSNISGRQFPCRECGKTFGSRSSQQIHIRIHTGERPYGCRFCWKAFADGGTLRKHERIHTGEKPYACAVCPRAFNQRVVLREHIRSHHSGPDPQYSHTMTPYCCAVCNDMFSTSQDLIIHLIHHCDLNTAMKRQPQVGPRKYKRRRKLKPHELELISNRVDNDNDDVFSDSDEKTTTSRRRSTSKKSPKQQQHQQHQQQHHQQQITPNKMDSKSNLEKDYESMIQSFESASQIISSIVNSKPTSARGRKKLKLTEAQMSSMPSRPKMIHTQKTRVPVDAQGDGRGRHKTKTLITRTTAAEHHQIAANKEKDRLNMALNMNNYCDEENAENHNGGPQAQYQYQHQHQDLDQDHSTFVTIKSDPDLLKQHHSHDDEDMMDMEYQTVETEIPDVANEETILAQVDDVDDIIQHMPSPSPSSINDNQIENEHEGLTQIECNVVEPQASVLASTQSKSKSTPVSMIKVTKNSGKRNNSLTPGRHIIGPGNKVIRIVKGGMLVSNKIKKEPELLVPDIDNSQQLLKHVKQEIVEPSPLHELAELSMQHAQNMFRCEMCSATFTDRSQLLMHVPVHI